MKHSVQLLDTPQFKELVRAAWLAPVRRSDIVPEYVPGGFSADQVWDALTAIRYAQSYRSPVSLAGASHFSGNWHNFTVRLQDTCRQIADLTYKGSDLDVIARDRAGTAFITQQYIEEMVTNLDFDGFTANYEDVRAVLVGDRPPVDAAETIAANYHSLMVELGDMVDSPFDEQTLDDMYARLAHGIEDEVRRIEQADISTGCKVPRSPLQDHYRAAGSAPESSIALPIDIANGRAEAPRRHPIMESMLVNCQFWRTNLYPALNNLMGCIASRFYLVREGYPVMRYVPKIRILEKWRYGAYDGIASFSFDEAMAIAHENGDWTAYYDAVMSLLLLEIQDMKRSLLHRAAIDERAMSGIGNIPYLTHRQRDVLKQAVLAPETEFAIAAHQKTYGIAYSTARADLEKLADAGYLTRFMSGSAYHYRAAANLRTTLAAKCPA
ncbi:hypothetical protein [Slackia heliotrinireducens]|uniref:hypothetical protein n=1 Tax=Slackia heliotrinireducens TaxID=84110 RepID=UPI003315177C